MGKKDNITVRFGGDEFVVMLPECDEDLDLEISDHVRKNFMDKTWLDFSFGVAKIEGDVKEALRIADEKMYRMKHPKRRSG